jgi:hypothetical protein
MAKDSSSIAGQTPAREGEAITRQWGESVGGTPAQGVPPEAALPGRRNATRIDSNFGGQPPAGGEGNGAHDRPVPNGRENHGVVPGEE